MQVLSSESTFPLRQQSALAKPELRADGSPALSPTTGGPWSRPSPGPSGPPLPSTAFSARGTPVTPRQQHLRDGLELPKLHHYPSPPGVTPEDSEDTKRQKLLEMYQEFVLELFTGMFLTQLTSNRDYSDIHCQLMEDLTTLKLDQSNGRIIEFPLTGVSKVYRIVKNDDKWYSPTSAQGVPMGVAEHIVVVEFMRRKLAFVFNELQASQRFLTCMELLIRRAQQKDMGRTLRSLYPAFPTGDPPSRLH